MKLPQEFFRSLIASQQAKGPERCQDQQRQDEERKQS
jgi:hypothetical protein